MGELGLSDITDLRAYEHERDEFRRAVIALKRLRRVAIGPLVSVVFENATTMRFQIQEMARAEKMSTDEQILEELSIYNPLIPGPGELSMTMFLELTNDTELREWLPRLVGIERSVIAVIGESGREFRAAVDPAHASQLTRDEITASVHYVRIQLPADVAANFVNEPARIGTDLPEYRYTVELSAETKASLADDWG